MDWISRLGFVSVLAGLASAAGAQQSGIRVDSAAVVGACLTPAQQARPIAEFSTAERVALMTCLQREVARQINPQLPKQVDDLTLLHVITTEGTRLTYHYKISLASAQVNAAQRAALVQNTRNHVCSQADMRRTISLGGSYGYVWIDPDNVEIGRTVIESC